MAQEKNQKSGDGAPGTFPIVGLGASAGGLEALETFLDHVPEGTGIGFVVVTHVSPERKSLLPELLASHSRMPMVVVDGPTKVEPDHVYFAAAGDRLTIEGSVLKRVEEPRQRLPIDLFFRALATDQKERAIGVVLSGTGTDGTMGMEEIKGAGGMVMAQDQASARFPGMPASAIRTELVDYVLPAGDLPAQLLSYVEMAFGDEGFRRPETPVGAESLERLFVMLRNRTGHDFSGYKRTTILRRIERRIHIHQLHSIQEYLEFLNEHPPEAENLFKELLINVTSFFRDAEAFELLGSHVLPQMLANKPEDYVVRVWVPGCSTGEEAYSFAILIREAMDTMNRHLSLQIFATDLDSQAVEFARTGLYPASIAEDIKPARLERFFTKEDDCYRVRKDLRERLVFAPQNLLQDPPFTKVDLLSCRNVLIYLESRLQQRLIPIFHYALRPAGILFLGSSEALGSYGHLFETVDKKLKIFRRKDGPGTFRTDVLQGATADPATRESVMTPDPPKIEDARLGKLIDRVLLEELVPPSALVHESGEVVHIHGRTGQFLEPAPGSQARVNIFSMLRDSLQIDLAAALRKSAAEARDVVHEGVRVKANGHWILCDLRVRYLSDPAALRGLLLVSFERPREESTDGNGRPEPSADGSELTAHLEHELQRMREYHQGAIEELETANEELKSTNEELQSTNEELQSTNEELETSKEEMQSVNEELQTLNEELENKIDELSRTNDDMKNLLNGTDIATVFLDNDLRIKRYTERAKKVINLIPSDVGRPIADLVTKLDYDHLIRDAQMVLQTLALKEVEIAGNEGEWFLMRILPYRTTENVIDGLVITFQDITKSKGLQVRQERILRAVRSSATIIFSQNAQLRYDWVSSELFGCPPEAVVQRSDADLLVPGAAQRLTELKTRALKEGHALRETIELALPSGVERWDVYVEPVQPEDRSPAVLIGSLTRC